MPCVNPDGTLTPVAVQVLRGLASLHAPVAMDAIAQAAGLPVYRARASLRELQNAGLVELDGIAHRITDAGRARLAS
jgi:DNA-binding IclR family transcriptional regulator